MFKRMRAVLATLRGETPLDEDRYGDDRTWQQGSKVNVEIAPDGHVVSVWFRCRLLPWDENVVDQQRAGEMRQHPPNMLQGIKAIVFEGDCDAE